MTAQYRCGGNAPVDAGVPERERHDGVPVHDGRATLELRRVLKPTGSLYLHCDATASHYLKILVDAVFGAAVSEMKSSGSGLPRTAILNREHVTSVGSRTRSCSTQRDLNQRGIPGLFPTLKLTLTEIIAGKTPMGVDTASTTCKARAARRKGTPGTKSWGSPVTGDIPKRTWRN